MLNGWYNGQRTGSGTIVWRARVARSRRARLPGLSQAGRLLRAFDWLLQHDGDGDHHALLQLPAVRIHVPADLRSEPRHQKGDARAARGTHLRIGYERAARRNARELRLLGDLPTAVVLAIITAIYIYFW